MYADKIIRAPLICHIRTLRKADRNILNAGIFNFIAPVLQYTPEPQSNIKRDIRFFNTVNAYRAGVFTT